MNIRATLSLGYPSDVTFYDAPVIPPKELCQLNDARVVFTKSWNLFCVEWTGEKLCNLLCGLHFITFKSALNLQLFFQLWIILMHYFLLWNLMTFITDDLFFFFLHFFLYTCLIKFTLGMTMFSYLFLDCMGLFPVWFYCLWLILMFVNVLLLGFVLHDFLVSNVMASIFSCVPWLSNLCKR